MTHSNNVFWIHLETVWYYPFSMWCFDVTTKERWSVTLQNVVHVMSTIIVWYITFGFDELPWNDVIKTQCNCVIAHMILCCWWCGHCISCQNAFICKQNSFLPRHFPYICFASNEFFPYDIFYLKRYMFQGCLGKKFHKDRRVGLRLWSRAVGPNVVSSIARLVCLMQKRKYVASKNVAGWRKLWDKRNLAGLLPSFDSVQSPLKWSSFIVHWYQFSWCTVG
jgi:hypothetical protein